MIAKFKKEETVNAILYIIKRLGGKCDIHKISKLLYFSDREHMLKYGRLITGDFYIAMKFGPVPSRIYDIFKFLRGDSYFSGTRDDVTTKLRMLNQYTVAALAEPDLESLSESEIECIDACLNEYGSLGFSALTEASHGLAWSNTCEDRIISYKDMLRETTAEEEYVDYVEKCIEAEAAPFQMLS